MPNDSSDLADRLLATPDQERSQNIAEILQRSATEGQSWNQATGFVRQHFGDDVNLEPARRGYEQTAEMTHAQQRVATRERNTAGTLPGFIEHTMRHNLPFGSAVGQAVETNWYNDARRRMREGRPQDGDYDLIAGFDRRRETTANLTPAQQALRAVEGVPAMVGEAYVGGQIVGRAGGLIGRALPAASSAPIAARLSMGALARQAPGMIGGAVARNAATTALMPSMWAPQWAERNLENDREPYSLDTLPPVFAHGMLMTAVLGSLGRAGNSITTPGVRGVAERLLTRTATGMVEQQGIDIMASAVSEILPKAYKLETGYGLLGGALRGEWGPTAQHAIVQAVTFAAFSGVHELQHGKPLTPAEATAAAEARRMAREDKIPVKVHIVNGEIVHFEGPDAERAKIEEMLRKPPEFTGGPMKRVKITVESTTLGEVRKKVGEARSQEVLEEVQQTLDDAKKAGANREQAAQAVLDRIATIQALNEEGAHSLAERQREGQSYPPPPEGPPWQRATAPARGPIEQPQKPPWMTPPGPPPQLPGPAGQPTQRPSWLTPGAPAPPATPPKAPPKPAGSAAVPKKADPLSNVPDSDIVLLAKTLLTKKNKVPNLTTREEAIAALREHWGANADKVFAGMNVAPVASGPKVIPPEPKAGSAVGPNAEIKARVEGQVKDAGGWEGVLKRYPVAEGKAGTYAHQYAESLYGPRGPARPPGAPVTSAAPPAVPEAPEPEPVKPKTPLQELLSGLSPEVEKLINEFPGLTDKQRLALKIFQAGGRGDAGAKLGGWNDRRGMDYHVRNAIKKLRKAGPEALKGLERVEAEVTAQEYAEQEVIVRPTQSGGIPGQRRGKPGSAEHARQEEGGSQQGRAGEALQKFPSKLFREIQDRITSSWESHLADPTNPDFLLDLGSAVEFVKRYPGRDPVKDMAKFLPDFYKKVGKPLLVDLIDQTERFNNAYREYADALKREQQQPPSLRRWLGEALRGVQQTPEGNDASSGRAPAGPEETRVSPSSPSSGEASPPAAAERSEAASNELGGRGNVPTNFAVEALKRFLHSFEKRLIEYPEDPALNEPGSLTSNLRFFAGAIGREPIPQNETQRTLAAKVPGMLDKWLREVSGEAAGNVLSREVEQHAAEIAAQGAASAREYNTMLKDAREALAFRGVKNIKKYEDSAAVPHLDEIAADIAERHPGHFDSRWGLADQLFTMLHDGNRPLMSKEEAHAQALEQIESTRATELERSRLYEEAINAGGTEDQARTLVREVEDNALSARRDQDLGDAHEGPDHQDRLRPEPQGAAGGKETQPAETNPWDFPGPATGEPVGAGAGTRATAGTGSESRAGRMTIEEAKKEVAKQGYDPVENSRFNHDTDDSIYKLEPKRDVDYTNLRMYGIDLVGQAHNGTLADRVVVAAELKKLGAKIEANKIDPTNPRWTLEKGERKWDLGPAEQFVAEGIGGVGLPAAPTAEQRRAGGIGGGQANAGEAYVPPPRETALAKRQVNLERLERDLDQLVADRVIPNQETKNAAMAILSNDPDAAAKLVDSLAANMRPASVVEHALLLLRRMSLHNDRDVARAEQKAEFANSLKEKRKQNTAKLDELDAKERSLDAQLDQLDRVTSETGTESGRSLQFRRVMIDADYSLTGMVERAERAKGSKLTEEERAKIEELYKQLDDLRKKLRGMEDRGEVKPGAPSDTGFKWVQVKAKYDAHVESWRRANAPWHVKAINLAGEAINLPRSIMASIDFPLLRQGLVAMITHPIRTGKAVPEMFRSFFSEEVAQRAQYEIEHRPNALLYEQSGLDLTRRQGPTSAREEGFLSRLVEKLPIIGHITKASERSYQTVLNRIRADSFDAMVGSLSQGGKITTADAKVIANYVNVMTGRGPLGQLQNASTLLNYVFFAPKWTISRFQLLLGQPLYSNFSESAPRARKLIATEYARLAGGFGLMAGLAVLAGFKMEEDPRSSDFGKLKVGNTRLDLTGGLASTARFLSQTMTLSTKNKHGAVLPLSGSLPYGADNYTDVFGRFLRGKLAPAPGAVLNLLSGTDVVGQPAMPASTAGNLVTPLFAKDVYEAMMDLGFAKGTAVSLLGLLGMSMATHDPNAPRPPLTPAQRLQQQQYRQQQRQGRPIGAR